MNRTVTVIAVIVVVLGGIAWYLFESMQEPPVEVVPTAEVAPRPEVATPVPAPEPEDAVAEAPADLPEPGQAPAEEPLPPLEESDAYVTGAVAELVGEAAVLRYFAAENVVHKAVATVDALGGRQVPKPILAIQGPAGEYPALPDPAPAVVIRDEAGDPIPQYVADPAGYARYTPYVEMLEAVSPERFVGLMRENEALFDEAYRQLGYADGRFEQRLGAVIDELLATPEVDGPLRLMKPEAYYLFVDEDLEALSAGQKVLLRMGRDNAARVKSWLREVRDVL